MCPPPAWLCPWPPGCSGPPLLAARWDAPRRLVCPRFHSRKLPLGSHRPDVFHHYTMFIMFACAFIYSIISVVYYRIIMHVSVSTSPSSPLSSHPSLPSCPPFYPRARRLFETISSFVLVFRHVYIPESIEAQQNRVAAEAVLAPFLSFSDFKGTTPTL